MSIVIFDSTIAKKVGINAAIIFERIRYFCEDAKNKNDHYKFHEGYFWTYSSSKSWSNMLPFLTQRQIEKAINDLIEQKMIITGNFNKNKYDRTRWFTNVIDLTNSISPVSKIDVPDNVKWKLLNEEMNLPLNVNKFTPDVEPIPNESSNESSNVVVDNTKKETSTTNANKIYNATKGFENRFSNDFQEIQDFLVKTEMPGLKKLSNKFYEYYKTLENLKIDYNNIAESLMEKQNYDFSDINQKRSFANTIAKILAKTVQND